MLNKILVFLFAFFYAFANENNNVHIVNSNENFDGNNFDNSGTRPVITIKNQNYK